MIAITVDCEQWNSPAIRGKKDPANDNVTYSKLGNEVLLKLFKKYKIKATFFTTGFFAERNKKQIKEISKIHEIADHGYCHFYRGNKNLNLEKDISKSKKILEKIIGKKILGFRSPQVQFSKKLIKTLEKLKFKYDSSIHAAYLPGFYDNRDKPLKPFKISKIIEIPASASYNLRFPFSWMFLRLLPLQYSVKIVRKLIGKGITPVIYVHSWEFYDFKSKSIPFYITKNVGRKFAKKFDKFLSEFKDQEFVMMKDLI